MPTVQICLVSVQRQLPTVTTAESTSNHPIANLYNSPNTNNGLFTEPKELTNIDFRNNFRSGFFHYLEHMMILQSLVIGILKVQNMILRLI